MLKSIRYRKGTTQLPQIQYVNQMSVIYILIEIDKQVSLKKMIQNAIKLQYEMSGSTKYPVECQLIKAHAKFMQTST